MLSFGLSRRLCILSTGLLVSAAVKAEVLEPVMVKVPSGHIQIGTAEFSDAMPLKAVDIDSFYVSQYEVTRKEFSLFVEDTGYAVPQQCYHEIGKWWFENESAGTWKDNAINTDMYEPVSCIGYDAAQAYTEWLRSKTGKAYRMLSEAEWEYIATYAEEKTGTPVCTRANVADLRGESEAQLRFQTSYVNLIGIEECDDAAGTVNVVGMYQANTLGIYDLFGNINEFVEDCYFPDYNRLPANGQAVTALECEAVVLRGGAWHWPLWSARIRDAKPRDWIGLLEGFRLALSDLPEQEYDPSVATPLRQGILQAQRLKGKSVSLPKKVSNVTLATDEDQVHLQWPIELKGDADFVVLANQYMGGRFEIVAEVSEHSYSETRRRPQAYQYAVARRQNGNLGPYSNVVDIVAEPALLPAVIQAEHFDSMDNALVFPYDDSNQFVTGPLSGAGDILVHYNVVQPEAGTIGLRLEGNAGTDVTFNVLINEIPRGVIRLNQLELLQLFLPEGQQQITLRTADSGWQLDQIIVNRE